MPTVRVLTPVSFAGGDTYAAGDEVRVDGQRAQDAVAGGWGELVREQTPETPEGTGRARRQARPERRGQ